MDRPCPKLGANAPPAICLLSGSHRSVSQIIFLPSGRSLLKSLHKRFDRPLFSDSLVNVLGFVVKEKYRNQGLGSMLIERLEQWGKNNGFSGIKLLSHPSRVHAHRFYERRGYMFTKDQKNFMKKFN